MNLLMFGTDGVFSLPSFEVSTFSDKIRKLITYVMLLLMLYRNLLPSSVCTGAAGTSPFPNLDN